MPRFKTVVLILFTAFLGAGIVFAAQPEASREKGKALFNDPALGSTGKSCNDCHPNGKGAEKAAVKSDEDIVRIVNACITQTLTFGDLDDPASNVSQLLDDNRHFRMHEELGTGPGFYYLWDRKEDTP